MLWWRHQRKGFIAVKIAYIRPDMGVQANDPSLIREVDRVGTVRYRNSDDQLHREDGPAVERSDGTREWWLDGDLHREDGPAIEFPDGFREWWIDGQLHREDGPAVEFPSGTREWWIDGLLHREDGPAVEYGDGTRKWYLGGKQLSEDEFEARNPATR